MTVPRALTIATSDSGGGAGIQADLKAFAAAVDALVGRLFPLATVVTPNLMEAKALAGLAAGSDAPRRDLATRLHELGAPAVIVTGGHGEDAVDHLFAGREHLEIPSTGMRSPRRTAPAARIRRRGARRRRRSVSRGCAGSRRARFRRRSRRRVGGAQQMISPGSTLCRLREQKPLVHQITNYVVMNETANATLALGALPVMAHAGEEVEEMTRLASALVLNIGTLSEHWVEAMLLAGGSANARRIPVVLDPVGAGATAYRTATAHRILGLVDVTVLRGNAGEVATLVGVHAEVRGVESMSAGADAAELVREAAQRLQVIASVTGAVDHVSDGERVLAVSNGHELLSTVTGTGCMSSAITGCFLAVEPDEPLEAAAEALAAFGIAAEDAAAGAGGPGTFHARLYDALYALDPETLDGRARIEEL